MKIVVVILHDKYRLNLYCIQSFELFAAKETIHPSRSATEKNLEVAEVLSKEIRRTVFTGRGRGR